jgi:hypothetical protein
MNPLYCTVVELIDDSLVSKCICVCYYARVSFHLHGKLLVCITGVEPLHSTS